MILAIIADFIFHYITVFFGSEYSDNMLLIRIFFSPYLDKTYLGFFNTAEKMLNRSMTVHKRRKLLFIF